MKTINSLTIILYYVFIYNRPLLTTCYELKYVFQDGLPPQKNKSKQSEIEDSA